MLSLHTNVSTLSAQNSISRTQNALSTSMTRLSTGFRINSAMDDAAGLQIATRLKAQTSGMAVAMRNTQNSISMMQTAEGALDEVTNILTRMKDLATQSADGSSSSNDRTAMQSEYDSLTKELGNIVGNTSFGGTKLLNNNGGKFDGSVDFQIGASSTEKMSLDLSGQVNAMHSALNTAAHNFNGGTSLATSATASTSTGTPGASTTVTSTDGAAGHEISDMTTTTTQYDANSVAATTTVTVNVSGATNANATIDKLQTAIDAVGTVRSALGAASNRLDHVYNNLANVSTNTKNATGRIMDVDFATESSNMTSNQMLLQAGTAMLKQTNSMSSMVMSLLQ